MPPRRSTRASVEPRSQPSQQAAKRKRGATEEKENIVQTVSVVKEVSDPDEDDEDEGTPPKRKRVSPALSDEEGDFTLRRKGRVVLDSDGDDDNDDKYEDKPVSKARKTPAKRASKASTVSKKTTRKLDPDSDDLMGFTNNKPVSKGRKTPARRAPKVSITSKKSIDCVNSDSEDAMNYSDAISKPSKKPPAASIASRASTPDRSLLASDSEPEQSLNGAPPTTQVLSQVEEEPKGPKSRLVIHKMVLVNFKSYAGRQEIGPFHKSFSSIVGPNGSGKSNTIDALLFVFGYRASKMRQGKLSELIHNSEGKEGLEECSVEVWFREIIDLPGPDAYDVVPDSSLVVARTAYRNNTSKYTINSSSSSFSEVQALLKGRGIDLDHKRFLILQGEVESIAQMKPKAATEHDEGLLEYLEDIIGTSKYKEPIEEALGEMEKFGEERGEKLNRLRLVEKEKDRLEEGKREAEGWLRLKNDHVRAQSRLWQWYLWKCLVNEEMFGEKIMALETELAGETEQNKDDIEHLEALEKHFEEKVKGYEELKGLAAEAAKDLAVHDKQAVGLEERRKHANGKAKKLKKSLNDDEHARSEALRAIDDSSEKMEREKRKVDEYEASLDKEEKVLEGIRDSLKDKTQVFHDQIEVKQKELQPWTAKINAKQAEVDVAVSERDALTKKAEAVREAGREAAEGLEKLNRDQETKMSELEELKVNKAGLVKEIKSAEKTHQDAQVRVQSLRDKASSSRQKADEAKASQAASTSQNKVLESLTKLGAAGRITGFHGRLGSLGTIPDKYDVAVSTACGALNNLIVDTVEQGQSCIEYLRRQNIGRASFIVLEKLPQTGLDKITTPENVPRLFDLIKPKETRFAPAFYKGVRDTLVAEDLDQANRIAFGGSRRWRVVTLAGQLIDASGTMSGGGNQVAKGGMSSKLAKEGVTPQVMRVFEKESEDAARLLEETLQELRRIELELDTLTKSGPQVDLALDKINLDIQGGSRRIAEAEKRVKELRSHSKPDAGDIARITTLEQDITSSTEELNELQDKSGKIEEAIKGLEKKILDIGGAKLLGQKSKVDGIRLHINLANDEITKAEVAKAKAEKDTTKLDGTLEANRASLEEVETELEDLNAQLEECKDIVSKLQINVDKAQAAAESSKDILENLKAELDAKTEEIQAFRQKEMELQQSLNDTKKEAAENERALDHWRTQHDGLKLEEIDDDDDDEAEPTEPVESTASPNAATDTVPEQGDPAEAAEPSNNLPVKEEQVQAKRKAREDTPSNELHIYSAEELSKFKKREMVADAELLDEKLKNAKPNLGVLKEYRKREEEFLKRAKDLERITQLRDAQKQKYDGLRKQRLDEFMAGFSMISMKLKEMYQMITLGGNAELELVDSMDPFSEGIIFSVMPPKKSWKNISNLSGGEKTLSSLALVFALHVFKPTPLYFMDEIDAALDFRNVSIVANYIKDRTKNAQFIIISLRNDMFELSHRLIGIYKTSNATQSISIDNHALTTIPITVAA